ncbi:aminodeoxychorismate/anthranilate synthase component II [Lachnospiraceae bacterium NSJ-143]|nr:aminodeoxychorismate/anthranilate synthase component II [Lachnospiraceae bacterium NSJ-143]
MILLIDNYDSFSYNLYQLAGAINPEIKVIRNDELSPSEIQKLNPEKIIISPGPGRPEDAGVCIDTIRLLAGNVPILGVCLGHQAIAKAFGAAVSRAKSIMHGKESEISIDTGSAVFKGLPSKISVARYHSLAAIDCTVPDCLKITGRSKDGEIMSLEHRNYKIYGLQFHPESIMTPQGKTILRNFIEG